MEQTNHSVVAVAHFASGTLVTVSRTYHHRGGVPASPHRPDNDNFNSPDPCPIDTYSTDTYSIDAESNTARFGTAMLSRLIDRLAAMNP